MRLGFFSVKFYLILIGNFTRFISKAGIAFFPITSLLPAAFGKHNISVKVLGSISKKILIKTLQTEACEKCVVTGSLPKVISFYEKLECAHLHPLPRGHRPLLGGGEDVSRGFDTDRKLSPWISLLYVWSWSSSCSCHPCPVTTAVQNVNAAISQALSPLESLLSGSCSHCLAPSFHPGLRITVALIEQEIHRGKLSLQKIQ